MYDAEGMPEDDVGVLDRFVASICDPLRKALRRFSRGLWHMAAGRVDLVVGICGSMSVRDRYHRTRREFSHFVTWTACLAKPALFHTNPPFFGNKLGTSLLTNL